MEVRGVVEDDSRECRGRKTAPSPQPSPGTTILQLATTASILAILSLFGDYLTERG
jgi:hypothetical protein